MKAIPHKKLLLFLPGFILLCFTAYGKSNLYQQTCTASGDSVSQAKTMKKLQGVWYMGKGYDTSSIAFCDLSCWLYDDFAFRYTYKLAGNLMTRYSQGTHKVIRKQKFTFCGDTLTIQIHGNNPWTENLVPYKTVLLNGRRVKLPDPNIGGIIGEEEWGKLFDRLEKEPPGEATIGEWNNLYPFTDGCIAEDADYRLATLYLKHPTPFLHYIYHFPYDGRNNILRIVFGGLSEIAGKPDKKRILHDIEKLSDSRKIDYLKNQSELYFKE